MQGTVRDGGRTRPRARSWLVGALAAGALVLGGCSGPGTPAPEAAPSSPTGTPSPAASGPTVEPEPEPTVDPTPEPEPEPGPEEVEPTEEPAQSEPDEPEPTEEPEPEEPAELSYGDSGDRVRELQERLADLGYWITAADGDFGPATQQAVWALQKAAGLSRDGVVGPATRAALDEGVRPRAQSGSGKVLEIDLSRQLVLAVEDGQVTRVINASSGNGERYEALGRSYSATTPRGTFQVGRQVDGNHASSLELGDMWRPKFFTGGIAVHGSPSIPPWPASHGCVRVANGAMNWIWDTWQAPPGTTVLVY